MLYNDIQLSHENDKSYLTIQAVQIVGNNGIRRQSVMYTINNSVLSPVTRKVFTKWHTESSLLLLGAGRGILETTLAQLQDYGRDWHSLAQPTTRANVEVGNKIYMTSNGCDEFIIVTEHDNDNLKQHLTIYLVK